MHKVTNKESFRSFDNLVPVLKTAFPNCDVLEGVTLARTKATYLITEAIGPFFRDSLLNSINKSNFFCILFDETTNAANQKELQISIRYFSEISHKVRSSEYMGAKTHFKIFLCKSCK